MEVGWCAVSDLRAAFVNCGGKQLKSVHLGELLFCLMSSNSPDAVGGLRMPLLLLILMKGHLVFYGRTQMMSAPTRNRVDLSLPRQMKGTMGSSG